MKIPKDFIPQIARMDTWNALLTIPTELSRDIAEQFQL